MDHVGEKAAPNVQIFLIIIIACMENAYIFNVTLCTKEYLHFFSRSSFFK